VRATMSPSMDIQVASNFERLLFELCGPKETAGLMAAFARERRLEVGADALARARELIDAVSVSEEETAQTMAEVLRTTGILVDPHTAVGIRAAVASRAGVGGPLVCLATAHPAKFPDAVEQATGVRPALPPRLADLLQRDERCVVLPNDLAAVQAHIASLGAAAP
jgi:threonine synthase